MRLRTFVITRSTRMIAIPPYLLAWEKKRPKLAPAVAPYFRKQRAEWQNALADFRNYQEHKDDRDSTVFAGRYELAHSEKLFDSVWRTIADVLAMLISQIGRAHV